MTVQKNVIPFVQKTEVPQGFYQFYLALNLNF